MNTILTVAKKELLDLFRDRRTVMIGLLMMPLLVPALLLGMSTLAEKKQRTQLESTLALPVIGAERAPNLVAFLKSQNIEPKRRRATPTRRCAIKPTTRCCVFPRRSRPSGATANRRWWRSSTTVRARIRRFRSSASTPR
jgi:hypothetical protein